MPGEMLGLGVTFALACVSATLFLFLRCEGKGRPFGPGSRWWALSVIGITSALSTAVAFVGVIVLSRLPHVFFGVGVAVPSWLWLGQIRNGGGNDSGRTVARDASTLWLARLLARMHEGMADDRDRWCDERVDPEWSVDDLHMAARAYHEYLLQRLSAEERRRVRIHAQLSGIETRLGIVQIIENGVAQPKVAAALEEARATREPRYARYLDDLGRLSNILRHDAERDLKRLISAGYTAGYRNLPVYRPAVAISQRASAPVDAA